MRITLCDIIGHRYASKIARENNDCVRCVRKGLMMTQLELADMYGDAPWWRWLLPSWMWSGVKMLFLRIVCRIYGHDWEDLGYATPESGCIDMVCKRCGYGPGAHWLY